MSNVHPAEITPTKPTKRKKKLLGELSASHFLVNVRIADILPGVNRMFDLDSPCPKCESDEYQGDFEVYHWGSGKLLLACETNCPSCDFENEYTTSLT